MYLYMKYIDTIATLTIFIILGNYKYSHTRTCVWDIG